MTDLQKKLREAVAFDEDKLADSFDQVKNNIRWQTTLDERFVKGVRHENARLAPILSALELCVEAIEAEVKRCGVWREGERALERLRKALEEKP